jgi:hypothetical protein
MLVTTADTVGLILNVNFVSPIYLVLLLLNINFILISYVVVILVSIWHSDKIKKRILKIKYIDYYFLG